MAPKIRSLYTKYDKPNAVKDECPNNTQQNQKDQCDINRIMSRFERTGVLQGPQGPGSEAQFGDFSECTDYRSSLERIFKIDGLFEQLSAKAKKKFKNDPQRLFEFLENPKNREEAIELGLVEKPEPPQEPKTPPAVETPPADEGGKP